jgi:CHAT domain-containing protein
LAVQEKTEAAVKQKMLQARMIHLATHGLLDSCEVKEMQKFQERSL